MLNYFKERNYENMDYSLKYLKLLVGILVMLATSGTILFGLVASFYMMTTTEVPSHAIASFQLVSILVPAYLLVLGCPIIIGVELAVDKYHHWSRFG